MKTEVRITTLPLELPPITIGGCGAVARFEGIVRGVEDGQPISALKYEAYAPMAEKLIRDILEDLGRSHPFEFARVHHRVGFVPVGEAAVCMDVHSKHRAEAFAVLQGFLDRLKRDVPIWKRNLLT